MRKTKKALATLAIAGMVLSIAPLQMFGATTQAADSTRLQGNDRIATAIAVADAGWTTADKVVVAPADPDNLVDALAAAPLAGQENAPILLTYVKGLDATVKAKIAALGAKTVYVVGAAANDAVTSGLTGVTVEKLSGANRWATADAINAKLTSPAGSFVVGYNATADALSAASYAAANKYQIVLTKADGTVDASKLKGSKTYLVGGTGVVADYASTPRLGGTDRFATNVEVVKGLDFSFNKVYVANGLTLADALVVAPLAAKAKAPVLLASDSSVAAASYVNTKLASDSVVVALGGTGVVSDSVKGSVAYNAPATLAVESVSVVNSTTVAIKFNKAVDVSTGEDTSKYSLTQVSNGEELTVSEANLQDDNQTVYLSTDALPRTATKYTVYVHDVLDTDGNKVTKYYSIVSLNDNVRPTVDSAEFENNNVFKVTFSEPVSGADNSANVLVLDEDDNEVDGLSLAMNDDNDELSISGVASLDPDKTYTLRILSGVTDGSGNVITPNPYEKTFSVKDDNTNPKVSSMTVLTKKAFKVKFSEPIADNDPYFSVKVDGTTETALTIDANDDETEFTVEFDSALDEGLHKITVYEYQDVVGNPEDNDASYAKYLNFVDTKPALESTKATIKTIGGTKYAVWSYDRDVDTKTIGSDITATRTDEDGITYDVTAAAINFEIGGDFEDNQLAFSLAGLEEGSYKLTLPASAVSAYGAGSAKADVTFVVSDSSSTYKVDTVTEPVDNSASTVKVHFTGEVGSSALDVANYTVDGSRVFESAVYYNDKQTVKLTIRSGAIRYDGDYEFEVNNIEDTNGKDVDSYDEIHSFLENVKPDMVKATVTSLNTIDVTFNEVIDSGATSGSEFTVLVNGSEVDVDTTSVDGKVVTLNLGDDISDVDATVVVKTSDSFAGKDANGNAGVKGTSKTATWDVE